MSYPQISRHEPTSLPGINLDTSHEHTESGILSPPDSPSGICDVTFRDAFDDSGYAEVQSFTETKPFFCTESNEPKRPNAFLDDVVYPLPQSSPFSSSSRSSNNSILDLDTSPRATIRPGRSDDLSEDVDYVDASLRSIHRPIFRQSPRRPSIREDSNDVDEARFTISSFTSSDEEDLEAERPRTVCCNDRYAFPSTGNNDSRHSFSSESGRGSIRDLAGLEVTEDGLPSDISIDFLSDPHPWETIGRILKLKPPEPSTLQCMKINFTKDREGVGYTSPEMSGTCNARSSDATPFETMINNQPTHDIRVASSADLPMFQIAGSEVLDADDHMATNTPDSLGADNSTRPLLDAKSPFKIRSEVDPCTPNEHAQSSNPLAIIVGATAAKPDVDVTFDGPCLFGDSDLDEDA